MTAVKTCVASALAVLVTLPAIAAAHLAVHSHGDLSYVSGGIGTEERQAIEAMSRDFNLRVTMTVRSGEMLGDTIVRIRDPQRQTVVDTIADGPLFLAQLKPGTYTVTCIQRGQELQQVANVTAGGQAQLTFTWASE